MPAALPAVRLSQGQRARETKRARKDLLSFLDPRILKLLQTSGVATDVLEDKVERIRRFNSTLARLANKEHISCGHRRALRRIFQKQTFSLPVLPHKMRTLRKLSDTFSTQPAQHSVQAVQPPDVGPVARDVRTDRFVADTPLHKFGETTKLMRCLGPSGPGGPSYGPVGPGAQARTSWHAHNHVFGADQ